MKRLILWTLTLFLLLTALTGGVVAYARTQGENPLKAYGFDVCDGKPCLMGVFVGMDWETAKTLLKNHKEAVIRDEQHMSINIKTNNIRFDVYPDTEGKRIVASIVICHNDEIIDGQLGR